MSVCVNPVTYPLSVAQREIWLAQKINPDSPAYNICQFTEIQGAVDSTLFEAALRQVIAEAESLRLQFIESNDGPRQFVGSSDWSLPLIDVSADVNPQAAAEAWMRADYEQPIDFLRNPLFGYALFKTAPNRFFWYQRYHHIVMDGAGGVLIAQRMAQVYSALVKGVTAKECLFGPLSLLLENDDSYRASAQFTKDQAYWLKHCADWPEPVTLAGRQAPALHHRLRQTTYLSSQSVRIHASDASRLVQLMIAAMAAYLHRLTGAQDVVLGFPVTARFGEVRRIPGMVSNIVPIRLTVQSDMCLSLLIKQVAQEIQRGFRHQRYRCEELRRELGLEQSQTLFGPVINLMPFDYDLSFGEYSSTNHNLGNGPVEDLMIAVYTLSDDNPLRIDFDANPALYTADELIAHQRRFLKFLDALATGPAQPISDIDLLDAAERRQLLVEWNATESEYPEHQCIHQLFEEQVERTPEATALVYEDQVLSYAELNARANRLAHQLIELGVQPDACVAICVERSPAMVVGLLATLKAGGAYVPLDPAYPSERLIHILADAAPEILLADAAGRTALGDAACASLTVLDPNQLLESGTTNPYVPELSSSHLAYVIYTSGSTGAPKGVMVEHQSVANLAQAHPVYFEMDPSSRVLQFASPSFDASIWEIVMALSCGACLSLPPDMARHDLDALWDYLERYAITHAILPPSLLQNGTTFPSLKTPLTLILGGEAPSATLLRTLDHQGVVFNAYGPTETTVCATAWRCPHHFNGEVVPIGRPLTNTQLYLLDMHGQLVPLGTVGELYIGGAGVARGYLNRPELTTERFLPDPFSDDEEARMYKTGDLARYLPDGNLEFLGRNDHQIKIRGFRIEPGEIETRLIEHPQVREAAVLALGEGSDKRLVAYVVAEADEQLASTLREHLAAKLPDYMMLAAFVRLDALPLTPNGKLDRRALPAPSDEAFARQAYEAPQGEIEITLANIWAELLQLEKVSRHDNFFALGGHSLLAMQMISRIRNMLGIEISLGMLFEAPTITGLAKRLLKSDGALVNLFDVLLPIKSTGSRPPLFCIHHGGGLSWSYFSLSQHLDADQPVYGLQASGFDGVSPLAETIDAMVADYIKQIRRVQPNGPYYLLGWSFGGSIAHSIAVQLEQQGERVALLALLDAQLTYSIDSIDLQEELKALYGEAIARYGDENMPTEEKSFWERTLNVHKNNARLAKTLSPLIYCGDMLYFCATIPQGESDLLTPLDLWKPHVLGDIEVCDIHSTHNDMDEPAPMAEIGRILAQRLDKLLVQPPLDVAPLSRTENGFP
ncbi:non-ribosomal peptide synthetase [Mycoavidus sp. HKI]|uniref:non-ribosomal peptide synthetase n=1 Tax=Mycoavidus sp. HKI TaxID=2840467 RepID=UPI001CBC2470|nr:non-ribosomal peptide synthetase [Mycoavidus sp. HKI]UAW64588.1 non-ribosomal peptide synthetase [Mycoavidus sp. HKI]